MTQNDVNFLQEALSNKAMSLLNEIVNNNNLVQQMREQQANAQEQSKETKKSIKKESK